MSERASPAAAASRTDTRALEPNYLAALEAEKPRWWSAQNFETWKTLYVSEYARGFDILETVTTYAPGFAVAGARVLDVGCGDAGALIAFAERGARCTGVEPDQRSLARAQVRAADHGVSLTLAQGAAEALPGEDGSCDLVLLDNVLEHVVDPRRTLAEARRVLAPGGLLYLVTPKPFALYSLWNDPHYDLAGLVLLPRRLQIWYFEKVRGGGAGTYDVGTIPTRRAVRRLLREHGFETLVQPRELWIRYLRRRIARPEEVKPGPKRWLARALAARAWPFENRVLRRLWDVALGSNIFLAHRQA